MVPKSLDGVIGPIYWTVAFGPVSAHEAGTNADAKGIRTPVVDGCSPGLTWSRRYHPGRCCRDCYGYKKTTLGKKGKLEQMKILRYFSLRCQDSDEFVLPIIFMRSDL